MPLKPDWEGCLVRVACGVGAAAFGAVGISAIQAPAREPNTQIPGAVMVVVGLLFLLWGAVCAVVLIDPLVRLVVRLIRYRKS
ncbi:MAG: hypothetical protein QHJ73_05755 [Armatimonadota bacterium]|nr:hypothetical protein [Armatimonadota bacterium]